MPRNTPRPKPRGTKTRRRRVGGNSVDPRVRQDGAKLGPDVAPHAGLNAGLNAGRVDAAYDGDRGDIREDMVTDEEEEEDGTDLFGEDVDWDQGPGRDQGRDQGPMNKLPPTVPMKPPLHTPVASSLAARELAQAREQEMERETVGAARALHGALAMNRQPNILHEFTGKRYFYDPTEYTSQDLAEMVESVPVSTDNKVQVSLVLYTVNATSPVLPFLLFAAVRDGDGYRLPQIELDKVDQEKAAQGQPVVDQNQRLQDACRAEAFRLLAFVPTPATPPDRIRLAAVFHGARADSSGKVTVWFEVAEQLASPILPEPARPVAPTTPTTPGKTLTWAAVHEWVNSSAIGGVPITEVPAAFMEEPDLLYIRGSDGVPIDIPAVLEPVTVDASAGASAGVAVEASDTPYGYFYLFSAVARPESDLALPRPRYAVFTDSCLYLIGTEEENRALYAYATQEREFVCVYLTGTDGGSGASPGPLSGPVFGVRTVDRHMRLV